jgi:hypothetical protein
VIAVHVRTLDRLQHGVAVRAKARVAGVLQKAPECLARLHRRAAGVADAVGDD